MQLLKQHNHVLCCLFGFVLLYNFLSWSINSLLLSQIETSRPKILEHNITILLWHWPFGVPYRVGRGVCMDKYEIPRCFLEDNQSNFTQADVVVFHYHELWTGHSKLPLHLTRPPMQKWLWLSLEPPTNNHNLSNYNGLFNWTMSYRRDADIFMPYGELVSKRTNATYVIPKKSDCLVCWVVSKYKANQSRSLVFQQLKKHIPSNRIEVYGQWSKRPLSKKKLLSTISRCYFYLAFENSISTDYISEKLWQNSLQAGSVPVVLGPPRNIYELSIPPESFIHVNDFSSVKALATFLSQVAADKERYESYFRWHHYYDVRLYTDWRERLCHICMHYDQLSKHKKVYSDLYSWVNS
ncbi:alpha-(1,3)-fucosyltransferase 7 [Pimephales promelas]|uniref:alpha-(1,3)-fucosyltransferase 7 n=1 Tax=Pimephales promelas TaxID=90988 RepID=UPI001955CADA|nr:alpha-(1,3)-fucosyltransferase 7 [Pimephales promelas]XP_039515288.1 alpha-(1,3)-fucosyltransferase 7 [Pimephales promelas]XP_039515290.1 alpha-(1,3)-fucosyltransferase 7 [Pimephales promelas]KAG1958428.1 3-galactosyl-N-acetylglucosaminide 4-alpha-L-fucosyltransferase FUT3 [Pimephales promelas]